MENEKCEILKRLASYLFSVVLVTLFAQCESKGRQSQGIDSTIVFVDISDESRYEIATLVSAVSSHNPEIIVLNAIFDTLGDVKVDSILRDNIARAGNVIFSIEVGKDISFHRSHSIFVEQGIGEGALTYLSGSDGVRDEYIPLIENDEEQVLSLPYEIAFRIDERMYSKFKTLRVNREQVIECTKVKEDFLILDREKFSSDLIENKIVIFGVLSSEGYFMNVNGTATESNSSVITANLILQLLSSYD